MKHVSFEEYEAAKAEIIGGVHYIEKSTMENDVIHKTTIPAKSGATAITTTWYWIAASWAIPCAPSLSSKRPRANKSIEKQGTVMFPAFFKYKLTG